MEPIHPDITEPEIQSPPGCANCNQVIEYTGTGTPLCAPCREIFIRYPIPLWIKLFGLGILLVLVISFIGLPQSLSTGIHFKRGKKAAENHNYIAAQKEFQLVANNHPDYLEAQAQLFAAAYYNRDVQTMFSTSRKLEGKTIDNEALMERVNRLLADLKDDFPSDSFSVLVRNYGSYDSIPEPVFRNYLQSTEFDYFALVSFAGNMFDAENYRSADSALNLALDHNDHNQNAIAMKISVKRQLKQLDSANFFIDRIRKECPNSQPNLSHSKHSFS